MRHYANHVGKLIGLTVDQRSNTLGHGIKMNTNYNRHLPEDTQEDFLYKQINPSNDELAELQAENKLLQEQLEFAKREIANLKRLLSKGDNVIDFPDSL